MTFKYAFTEYSPEKVLTAQEYLEWDIGAGKDPEGDGISWRASEYYTDEIGFTDDNIKFIEENATLMTNEELEEFISYDYSKTLAA